MKTLLRVCFKNADKGLFGAGWGLLAIGIAARVSDSFQGLPSMSIALGIGCGFILVGSISMYIKMKNPNYVAQQGIEQNDERNILIRGKAGYLNWLLMSFVLAAMVIAFFAMDYKIPTLLATIALAIHATFFFAAMFFYDKKV